MSDRHRRDSFDDDASSGAYSLDALNPEERAAFERRLAESEELRAEVAGFTDTAALLAAAAPEVAPPARLKASIFAQLDSVPQLPAEGVHAAEISVESAPEMVHGSAESTPELATVTSMSDHVATGRRRAPRHRFATSLVAIAAAVALFGGGIVAGNFLLGGSQSVSQADQLAALVGSEDVERSTVTLPDGSTASLFASAELEQSAVVLSDAPDLPADSTYQAWFVRGGEAISAAVMDPKSGENFMLLDHYQADDVVALTVEPVGGSKHPTTDAISFDAV